MARSRSQNVMIHGWNVFYTQGVNVSLDRCVA